MGLALVLLAWFLALPVPCGWAMPVIAEARVEADNGDLRRASRTAVRRALAAAVEQVLQRYLAVDQWQAHGKTLRRAFLRQPSSHVLRYVIASERWEDMTAVVEVHAEVDHERLLQQLRDRGIPTQVLSVLPRVAVLSGDQEPARGAARAVRRVLEQSGYRVWSPALLAGDDVLVAAAAAARQAGCHFAVVLMPVAGAPVVDETAPAALPEPESQPQPQPQPQPLDRWLDPSGEPLRETAELDVWVVETATDLRLADLTGSAAGFGEDRPSALAHAARRAGIRVGQQVLRLLEQSGWSPGIAVLPLELAVRGVPDPRALEQVHAALAEVAEVRQVQLYEVGAGRVIWRLEVSDSGLPRAAVLNSVHLPRGTLQWRQDAGPLAPMSAAVVEARWVAPALR